MLITVQLHKNNASQKLLWLVSELCVISVRAHECSAWWEAVTEIGWFASGCTVTLIAGTVLTHIRMCVCMYACAYVCMYVYYMYVCVYVCMYCMYMYVCMYAVHMYVCMYVYMHVCMCVCMYVCMCRSLFPCVLYVSDLLPQPRNETLEIVFTNDYLPKGSTNDHLLPSGATAVTCVVTKSWFRRSVIINMHNMVYVIPKVGNFKNKWMFNSWPFPGTFETNYRVL